MSIHKSLHIAGGQSTGRSVFTRRERIEKLMSKGNFEEGDSVYGLPKVRTAVKTLSKKQLKALHAARMEAEALASGEVLEPAEGEEAAAEGDEAGGDSKAEQEAL